MAQQTINIGASPNDGTGTPLRTAFQYTNSNFSELYTALGGGSGLPGATTQVIFNDGGTNLAGDAGLVYNKTTDALTIGGNVQAASATITGDLTVDTSTLKVDSANDRVGIGIASSLLAKLHVSSTGSVHINQRTGGNGCFTQYIDPVSSNYVGTDSGNFRVANNSAQDLLNIQQLGVFAFGDGAGGTRMTLNSTGLGVGTSPTYKLDVSSSSNIVGRLSSSSVFNTGFNITNTTGSTWSLYSFGSNDATLQNSFGIYHQSGTSFLQITQAGNVGIGVTPSAWGGSYKALQLQSVARSIAATGAGVGDLTIAFNAIYDSTDSRWEYAGTGDKAGRYSQTGSGNHRWFVSNTAGTAGNEITDFASAAMTLDASGNLLVGVTSALFNSRLRVKTSSTSASDYGVYVADSADALIFALRNDGLIYTGTKTASPYNNTTGSAANAFIAADGTLGRSTSSLKYKTDITDSTRGLADVLKLRPVTYKSKNGDDTIFGGLIAEEVHAAGLTEFVAYAPDNAPDAIHYSNMVSLLVAAIKELTARVQTLEAK